MKQLTDKDITIITYKSDDARQDTLLYKRCRQSISKFLPNATYLEFNIEDKLKEYLSQSAYLRNIYKQNVLKAYYTDVFRVFDAFKYENVLYIDKDIELLKDPLPYWNKTKKNFIGSAPFFFSRTPDKELAKLKNFYLSKQNKPFLDVKVWKILNLKPDKHLDEIMFHYSGFIGLNFYYVKDAISIFFPRNISLWPIKIICVNKNLSQPIINNGVIIEVKSINNLYILYLDFLKKVQECHATFTVTSYKELTYNKDPKIQKVLQYLKPI